MIVLILGLALLSCVPLPHKGWTRADVVQNPMAQQNALDRDRQACASETAGRPLLHQALLGDLELTMCLERRGWRRVP